MASHKKIKLAKNVSADISQQDFENEMKMIFEALSKCWAKAF